MKVKINQPYIQDLKNKITDRSQIDIDDIDEAFIPEKESVVLSIEGDYYRIISEDNAPFTYPREVFMITDPTPTLDWDENGHLPFDTPGFIEDYFDTNPEAVKTFNIYLERIGLPFTKIITPEGFVRSIMINK